MLVSSGPTVIEAFSASRGHLDRVSTSNGALDEGPDVPRPF